MQSFNFTKQIGGNGNAGGGIIAAITSVIVLGVGLILGSFLLLAGIVVGIGLLIAFLVWRFFFMRSMKKKAAEFMENNEDLMRKMQEGGYASSNMGPNTGPAGTSGPINKSRAGSTVIDGEFEDVTNDKP